MKVVYRLVHSLSSTTLKNRDFLGDAFSHASIVQRHLLTRVSSVATVWKYANVNTTRYSTETDIDFVYSQ